VLDDIERWRFLVEPAREDPLPALVDLLDVELDERSGERWRFPWRGGFARPQPDDRIAHPQRLPRLHCQVANDAVALVEQADHRDPLGHRRLADILQRGPFARVDQRRLRLLVVGGAIASAKQRGGDEQERGSAHAYSGVHAW
jgi:hypothetical protein